MQTGSLRHRAALTAALVVMSPRPGPAQTPSFQAVRDTGFQAPDLGLSWVRGVLVDRKHRVYVPDETATTLYRLSEDGRESKVVVKPGAGPGEARTLQSLAWLGDTLVILDNRLNRLTFLDPEGKLIRTENIRDRCVGPNAEAVLRNGSCFEEMWQGRPPGAQGPPPPVPIVVGRHKPPMVDTIYVLSIEHSAMQFDRPNASQFLSQPFSDGVFVLAAEGGSAVVQVERPVAGNSRLDSLRLRRWEPGRGWSPPKSLRYTPKPLTRRVVDSVLTGILQARGSSKPDPFGLTLDSLRAKAYRPDYFPPVSVAIPLRDGSTWLQMEAEAEFKSLPGLSTWLVLDSTFTIKRLVQLPATLRISTVDQDLVWGTEKDEDDVPIVVRYRVVSR